MVCWYDVLIGEVHILPKRAVNGEGRGGYMVLPAYGTHTHAFQSPHTLS